MTTPVQAWAIKGPDGRLWTNTSDATEDMAWWNFCQVPSDKQAWIKKGYRAVPVTISEREGGE